MDDLKAEVTSLVRQHRVVIFSQSKSDTSRKVKELFDSLNVEYKAVELDLMENGSGFHEAVADVSKHHDLPVVFVAGKVVGGVEETTLAHQDGTLAALLGTVVQNGLNEDAYDYDLVVVGGGSGGLACSKAAAVYGKRVAVLDFVKPSPLGTSWGLGGTCVNVGCIPKKLMHQAALLGRAIQDAKSFGWQVSEDVQHKWEVLVEAVQNHIKSLNWGYRVSLQDKHVKYLNAFAEFVDKHTLKTVNRRGKEAVITFGSAVVATGMRPRYPDIPGAKEYGITSDDLFSMKAVPGKTLVVGASYVALECAGFLAGLGFETTCMVRSILLRGFDQQLAEKIGAYMAQEGVKFIRPAVPTKVELVEDGPPRRLRVEFKLMETGETLSKEFNTVMFAIGRDACTQGIGLEKLGVKMNPKNGQLLSTFEQTSVPNIYGIGDVLHDKPELTPVAIQAGKLLADRLFGGRTTLCDYVNVPTTVFTPLEYGCIGLSEEDAISQKGSDNIEVYHSYFHPLEWTLPKHDENTCYMKLICDKSDDERVIGLHVLGPNAGEITQGYGVALKCGATKKHFDATIGIHPTCSESMTTLNITKSSGEDPATKSC